MDMDRFSRKSCYGVYRSHAGGYIGGFDAQKKIANDRKMSDIDFRKFLRRHVVVLAVMFGGGIGVYVPLKLDDFRTSLELAGLYGELYYLGEEQVLLEVRLPAPILSRYSMYVSDGKYDAVTNLLKMADHQSMVVSQHCGFC